MLIKKIAQSCRGGNKAKFAYLPTQTTQKTLYLTPWHGTPSRLLD